jgi:hypothetical protein
MIGEFNARQVYMFPKLLENISLEPRKHMQGKSGFNFKKVEPELFKELAALTKREVKQFRKET